jgi:hypothetical protein
MSQSSTQNQLIKVLETIEETGGRKVTPQQVIAKIGGNQRDMEDFFQLLVQRGWVTMLPIQQGTYVDSTPLGRQILRDPQYGSASMGTQVFNINAPQSIVNIQSTMSNVTQMINAAPAIEQSTKDQLLQLVQELTTELEKAPADAADDVEVLANEAQMVITDATKDKPNRKIIQIRLEGLRTAATDLATVVPSVLPIAIKIADLLK